MKKSTRSILEELNEISLIRNKDHLIESKGVNLVSSAINLLKLIRENYDIDTATDLERRFINAMRTGDSDKFKRGMQKVHESRKFKT
ncbi:hypothetical protein EB118_23565 [bacterium]|nr:hypothetical protein [Actinomycetota bacterium]NDG33032.1 hypothetical protein [bacterium]